MIKVEQAPRTYARTTKRGMYERNRFIAHVIEGDQVLGTTDKCESHDDAYKAGMVLRKQLRLAALR